MIIARALHLKVLDEAEEDFINSEATELMTRKLFGTMKAFGEVKSRKDWEAPKGGGPKGWKSRVNQDVLKEHDSLGDDPLLIIIPGTEGELRSRLKEQALLRKHLAGSTD